MALVLSSAQMRAVDRAAIEGMGVPGLVLMENAGRGVAEAIARLRPHLVGLDVRVVCGAGQNGGDGFVIARHLANRGARVSVYLVAPRARVSGDAAINLQAADRTAGVVIEEHAGDADVASWRARLVGASVLVDAVFGTGLRADVSGVPAAAITAMNAVDAVRVAVDVPSGLDADTGSVRAIAVDAHLTVTMGARKLGLVLDPEAPVGRLEVVDLGVSVEALAEAARAHGPLCHWLDDETIAPLLPRQRAGGHKGTRGHLLVVAGSTGKTGAAILAARAALRGGAGLVTVASTRAGQEALDAKVLEPMTACYAGGDDADEQSWDHLTDLSKRMSAVAVGPGIPTGPGMRAVVARMATELDLPLVLDADALNLLGIQAAAVLGAASAPRLLTPHPGEMARLLGTSTREVQGDRLGAARTLARSTGAVIVLKGARTVVALSDGTAFINPTADPALGTAGSGDVLSGFLGALCAQGLAPADAARVGVFVHGAAAAEARRTLGLSALLAGDLPEAIARVLERLPRGGDRDWDRPSTGA
jgi:ADP-dependent NAD(P)H-hydrate dehydratase / NAD(P)H-hydrate epimerase